ncbi:MAG: signal peptidase I [Tissierellia bacterium]|nr:signal peptidase I [Bacillota bacterium]NLL22872.1 signal peptidase I [Tissierellia bacterium]
MNERKQEKVNKSLLREWTESFLWALALVVLFYIFFSNAKVYSYSMQPTLSEGENLLILRHASLKRGDIVTFKTDEPITEAEKAILSPLQRLVSVFSDKKVLVKRVIGLPGETIEIREGFVYIDGESIEEPYVADGTEGYFSVQIPEGYYALFGDNRQNSLDSRSSKIGLIKKEDIIGRAVLRYWPLSKIQFF